MKKAILLFTFLFWAVITHAQWVEQSSGSTHWFNSLQFIDSNTGWICGFNGSDNMLLHTTDGGTTWVPQGMPATSFLGEVTFFDATTGWAVGVGGVIFKSTDGGETWAPQTIATTKALQSVWFTDVNTGWIVGESGIIFHTTDGGATWDPQNSGVSNRLIRVRFLDGQTGWATGWGGTVLYTSDGGTTWTPQTSNTFFDLISISIIDADNVWLAAAAPVKGDKSPVWDNGYVLHTSDAGTTWTQQYVSSSILNGVSFANLNEGWAFGSEGTIVATGDGGATWAPQVSGVATTLTVGQFTNTTNGWATGENGVILYTSNGGFPVGIGENASSGDGLRLSNDPNPFTGSTRISYFVTEPGNVEVCIYDITGKLVATLVNGNMNAGSHSVTWNASNMAGGVYFCTLKAGEKMITKKLIGR
jgi:photosystem II stability/assembly factor-like uncharacterized protein